MHCVFKPETALCQTFRDENGIRQTPDLTDCRPKTCRNVAYTDNDIATLQRQARGLRALARDPLAPSIRHDRERVELERISAIILEHHRT